MKGTVFLICDIYPELEIQNNGLYQEWESKRSVEHLRDTLYDLGFKVEIYEPIQDKIKLLNRLRSEIKKNKDKTPYFGIWWKGFIPEIEKVISQT